MPSSLTLLRRVFFPIVPVLCNTLVQAHGSSCIKYIQFIVRIPWVDCKDLSWRLFSLSRGLRWRLLTELSSSSGALHLQEKKHRKKEKLLGKSSQEKKNRIMHVQVKHILRLNHCASLQRKRTLGRKLWTVSAAQQRGEKATGSHVSADLKTRFAPRFCRNYASDAAYSRAFASARDDPVNFWGEVGQDIIWFEPWSKTLHVEDPVFPNW